MAVNEDIELKAKELFDSEPHNLTVKRPGGERITVTPKWEHQPEHLKDLYRKWAKEGGKPLRNI